MRKYTLIALLLLPAAGFAQPTFTDATQAAGIQHRGYCQSEMTGGVVWFDYDADGDEDLYTTGGLFDNVLYRNNGDGTFTDQTAAAGLSLPAGTHTQGVLSGDIDNDGYRELFVTTWFTQPNFFFKNNGNGTFSNISVSSGLGADTIWTSAAAFDDFNGDGLLDLYAANYVREPIVVYDSLGNMTGYAHRCDANSLWINNGDLTFTDMASSFAVADTGCGLALALSDYDMDHDRDIFIANDFGDWVTPNVMYRNEWPAPFSDMSSASGLDVPMYGMGVAAGDYDHDLDPDYYITDIGPSSLFRNDGGGSFSDVAASAGVINDSVGGMAHTAWGTAFFDYDNDTWQDLIVANGYIQLLPFLNNSRQDPDQLYRNLGNGTFQNVSMAEGLTDTNASRGLALSDYDQDGDLDVFINVIRIDTTLNENSRLYRNDLNNGQHWLQVSVQGTVSNRDGFGSTVYIKAGGLKQMHEIMSGSSHMSQNTSVAHFGLGASTTVDSLWVVWPNGTVQTLSNIPADDAILVIEDTTLLGSQPQRAYAPSIQAWPNPYSSELQFSVGLRQSGALHWALLDMNGKTVAQGGLAQAGMGTHHFSHDGADLPNGLYMLLVRGPKAQSALRVQKID